MEKIRLLLVDDHDVIRQGLKTLFEGYPDLEVIAEAASGAEAIEKAIETNPDVTLMDITMPDMDGIEATRLLKEKCPSCEILALTVHEDKQFLINMLAAGASGYVSKRSLADDVVAAIKAVAAGESFLTPMFTRFLIEDFRRLWQNAPASEKWGDDANKRQTELNLLSKREQEVVQLVAEGCRSAQIGEQLGITVRTVSRHRARIMEKLEIHSSAELVRFAIRTGLVKP